MQKRPRLYIEATPITSDHMSGVGHVVLETIKALDTKEYKIKYDIRIFVPFNERRTLDRFNFKYVKIVSLPILHKVFSLLSRMKIGIPLDILLGKGVYIFPNYRNWNLLFSHSITYIHDVCFAIYPQYVQERNRNYLLKYMKLWISRSDEFVTVSQTSRDEIIKYLGVDSRKVTAILNGVNRSTYLKRSDEEVNAVKQKYGIEGNYFLYLSNIEPRKNLETLVKAFGETRLQKSMSLVLIGGDGWLNEAVYAEIDRIRRAGYRVLKSKSYVPDEDIPALMSGATTLVQPSWHEGFGIAVVQALACGTPAICADIPSLREVSLGNEEYITFFNPKDQKELTQKLVTATSSEKTYWKKPTQLYSWDEAAVKLIKVAFKGLENKV